MIGSSETREDRTPRLRAWIGSSGVTIAYPPPGHNEAYPGRYGASSADRMYWRCVRMHNMNLRLGD